MKQMMQLEQLAQLALAIAGLYYVPVHVPVWAWPIIFLLPDVSMLGYLASSKVGAVTYNIAHHKMTAAIVIAAAWIWYSPVAMMVGLILWGHSAFDRLMGYGLKYGDSFHHTHLGMVGQKGAKDNHLTAIN